MEPVFFLILFIFGASLGSFLYATALRLASGEDFSRQRSHCVQCGSRLGWLQLIPIISYVFLGGACKTCRARLSLWYLGAELFMGGFTALLGAYALEGLLQTPFMNILLLLGSYAHLVAFFFYLLAGSLLFILFVVDLKTQFILMTPVRGMILVAAVGLLFSFVLGSIQFLDSGEGMTALLAVGITFGMFLLWAGTRGKGMGYGDIELSALLSLLLPYPSALLMVLISFWSGALLGIGLMVGGGYTMKSRVPFGPFLIVGFFVALFWGEILMARLLPLY